ncbi:hypothetical protein [uncultured Duncaniella sp.]|uniref:hypothetical protein n=1 Tax=uncultured Duncaniella sp. TaxID=2768039 RepID=UPI0025A96D38|nr:hypothetical protein [uncultured Duncaniella sp.]
MPPHPYSAAATIALPSLAPAFPHPFPHRRPFRLSSQPFLAIGRTITVPPLSAYGRPAKLIISCTLAHIYFIS